MPPLVLPFPSPPRTVGTGTVAWPRAAVRAITALVLRDIAQAGGRTAGGYLWTLAAPVAAIALLSAAFSLVLHDPPLGTSFALFYASGLLPFRMYAEMQAAAAAGPRLARGLLAYPAMAPIDTILARAFLCAITQTVAALAILAGLMALAGAPTVPRPGLVLAAFALAAALGLGLGILNAVAFDRFPAWQVMFSVLSRPLLLVSGVIWLPGDLPAAAQKIVLWNPLVHIVGLARSGLYPAYQADYAAPGFVIAVALALSAAGLAALRLHGRRFSEG